MVAKFFNGAKMMVSGTPGTGTITLGSAVSPFLTFANAGVSNGDVVTYTILDGTSAWEIGHGTYTASGTTLSRDTVLNSSNSGSKISASSAAIVFIDVAADDLAGVGLFSVNRNGTNQTGGTAGVFNKIQFTNAAVDANGWFDVSTNFRYQPTKAGWYMITLRCSAVSNGETCQAGIFKNGSGFAEGLYIGSGVGSNAIVSSVSDVVQLNGSTDYVEGYIYLPTTVTTIDGRTLFTSMYGFRINGN